jgi:formylglycine-generating enzyme required for sulfatase activity
MRRFPCSLILGLMMLGGTSCAVAADPPELDAVLKRFVAEFVEITPGKGPFPASFAMGSKDGPDNERPVHTVTLSQPFWINKYEVPQNLYQAVTGQNPSRWKGPRNSVESMTWPEAVAFCEKATQLLWERKLVADNEVIRLPSEAEWEYCCRAGTTTKYSFGDALRTDSDPAGKNSMLDKHAWYTGNAAGNDPAVGVLAPNPWGLYDIHGYLWEFTADRWEPDYAMATKDGVARGPNADRPLIVVRGGSWKDPADRLQSSSRRGVTQRITDDAIGFRCVRSKAP